MFKSLWGSIAETASKNTAAILKENILFQDLSHRELKFVTNIVHIRNYRAGENIFHQGQTGFGMYIIATGAVRISFKDSSEKNQTGETILTNLSTGDFFGELALVEENGKRSASARAVSETRLIGFFKPDFFDIIQRKPATGVKISLRLNEVLGKRLVETNKNVKALDEKLKTLTGKTPLD